MLRNRLGYIAVGLGFATAIFAPQFSWAADKQPNCQFGDQLKNLDTVQKTAASGKMEDFLAELAARKGIMRNVLECAGGPKKLSLIGVADFYTQSPPIAEIAADALRHEVQVDHHFVKSVSSELNQSVLQNRSAMNFEHWLWNLLREPSEAGPISGTEHDGSHAFPLAMIHAVASRRSAQT